jgi:hypothetical protein
VGDLRRRAQLLAACVPRNWCKDKAIWIGTEENRKILRVDIDTDGGCAALRWLPDGTHAVELPTGKAIRVLERMGGAIRSLFAVRVERIALIKSKHFDLGLPGEWRRLIDELDL